MEREQKKNVKEFQEDILGEIISRLPLKVVVQCKLLSKKFNRMISQPEFSQTLFQRHKDTSPQLIYSIFNGFALKQFRKISLNPITQSVTTLPDEVEILASCNGLILIDFERVMHYCVFNPTTREHQLIPYPKSSANGFERTGLAVDYPNSDQYKLVTISNLVENSNLFYKFHLISSEQSGLWREIQLRTNNFLSIPFGSPPVYWRDSLYWLRSDGSVLAFDTKREEAMLIDRPEFLDLYDRSYGKILTGQDIWLGMAHGLLTLVFIFRMYIVIAAYDSANRRWRITHTKDNFILGPEGFINGFPVWIDSKQVSFLVERPLTRNHDLFEYDTNTNVYENTAVLHRVNYPMYCFRPTLAFVHTTPFNDVTADHQAHIAANLYDIRRFIIEGISNIQEESSSSSSSSSSSAEEEAGEGEEAG